LAALLVHVEQELAMLDPTDCERWGPTSAGDHGWRSARR